MTAASDGDVASLFKPEDGPIVIVANPASVFPAATAETWRARGYDVRIVTRFWDGAPTLQDGTPILASRSVEGRLRRRWYAVLGSVLSWLEMWIYSQQRERYAKAMQSYSDMKPFYANYIVNGLSIARYVRTLRPQFVFGMEVSSQGPATAFCRGVPRILMPWGGDIYLYAETTSFAHWVTRYVMRTVDLIVPASYAAVDHIVSRFGVDRSRVRASVGCVKGLNIPRPAESVRSATLSAHGMDSRNLIVMGVRRFLPAWGSDLVLKAFIMYAKENAAAHFVLFGGPGSEAPVAEARLRIHEEGLDASFTIFDGHMPAAQCIALLSSADIAVAVMRVPDMQSASILQSSSAGAAPVLSDQPEYRHMEKQGFRALFVKPEDPVSIVDAIRQYAQSEALRREVGAQNSRYAAEHQNSDTESARLLHAIKAVCRRYHGT